MNTMFPWTATRLTGTGAVGVKFAVGPRRTTTFSHCVHSPVLGLLAAQLPVEQGQLLTVVRGCVSAQHPVPQQLDFASVAALVWTGAHMPMMS
jgi:hypothetical protein